MPPVAGRDPRGGQREQRLDRRDRATLASRAGAGAAAALSTGRQGGGGSCGPARDYGSLCRVLRRRHGHRSGRPRSRDPAARDRTWGRHRLTRACGVGGGGQAQCHPAGRRHGVPRARPADRAGYHRHPVRIQVLHRPAGPDGGVVVADSGLRVRHRADSQLPSARRDGDRDPGPVAGRARLHVPRAASLGADMPGDRRDLAPLTPCGRSHRCRSACGCSHRCRTACGCSHRCRTACGRSHRCRRIRRPSAARGRIRRLSVAPHVGPGRAIVDICSRSGVTRYSSVSRSAQDLV